MRVLKYLNKICMYANTYVYVNRKKKKTKRILCFCEKIVTFELDWLKGVKMGLRMISRLRGRIGGAE